MSQWITGLYAVSAIIHAGRRQAKALCTSNALPQPLVQCAREQGVSVRKLSPQEMKRLAPDGVHQGVLLETGDYPYTTIDDILAQDPKFLLVLDQIQDPHNCGALLRSAFAFGVEGVIMSKDHSVAITPAVVRSSAGASEFLKICRISGLAQQLAVLKKKSFWIIGADAGGIAVGDCTLLTERIALVMGGEGEGLRRTTREACDQVIKIPMQQNAVIESLNVSVAGGILMWECSQAKRA